MKLWKSMIFCCTGCPKKRSENKFINQNYDGTINEEIYYLASTCDVVMPAGFNNQTNKQKYKLVLTLKKILI